MPDSDATPCPRLFASGLLLLVSKYLDSRGDVKTERDVARRLFARLAREASEICRCTTGLLHFCNKFRESSLLAEWLMGISDSTLYS